MHGDAVAAAMDTVRRELLEMSNDDGLPLNTRAAYRDASRAIYTALSPHDDAYLPTFGEPVSGWFRWFAWRPVDTVDRGWRWLVVVHRRRIHKHQYLSGGMDWWFQHAVKVS
jgi:hypothetical protein